MSRQDTSREQELEKALRDSRSLNTRKALFKELSRIYALSLQAVARSWAHARRTSDPEVDGAEALANAFIILSEKLPEMNFEFRSLEAFYKARIWSELGHLETRRRRRVDRSVPLEDSFDCPDYYSLGAEDRLVIQESLRRIAAYVKTPAKQRILRAALLKAEGYSWAEAAKEVEWSGSHESLRVSFVKLRREMLSMGLYSNRGHSTNVDIGHLISGGNGDFSRE